MTRFFTVSISLAFAALLWRTSDAFPNDPCEEPPDCPQAPAEYQFGDLIVLEGNVIDVSAPMCPDKRGISVSVAVTAPAQGDPMFAVAWMGGSVSNELIEQSRTLPRGLAQLRSPMTLRTRL